MNTNPTMRSISSRGLKMRFFFLLFVLFTYTVTFAQKTTSAAFIKEHPVDSLATVSTFSEILSAFAPQKLVTNSTGYLKEENPTIILQGTTKFPTTGCLFEVENKEDISFSIFCFGKIGLNASVIFPCVRIYNEDGSEINDLINISYELKSPGMVHSFHHFSEWKVNFPQKGKFYILIAADNSETLGGNIKVYGSVVPVGPNIYIHNVSGVGNVNRGVFGKFKISILKSKA